MHTEFWSSHQQRMDNIVPISNPSHGHAFHRFVMFLTITREAAFKNMKLWPHYFQAKASTIIKLTKEIASWNWRHLEKKNWKKKQIKILITRSLRSDWFFAMPRICTEQVTIEKMNKTVSLWATGWTMVQCAQYYFRHFRVVSSIWKNIRACVLQTVLSRLDHCWLL